MTQVRAYFRRAYIADGCVGIEVGRDECFYLPNPNRAGQRYDPEVLLRRVIDARRVDLNNWRRREE